MDTNSANVITSLKRKLQSAAKEVQSIHDQGKLALTDTKAVPLFKAMFRALDRYFSKYESYWDELLDMLESQGPEDFPTDKDKNVNAAIKRYYYECNSYMDKLTAIPSASPVRLSTNATLSEANSSQTLPRINILPFNGELVNWPRFRDTYISLVHNDVSLSSMQKYHYLLSFLTGPAASAISHLKLEEANYDLAWKSLNETFDNKRMLAAAYLNKIINFKPLHHGSVDCLKTFITQVADSVAAFKLLKINDEAEFILFHLAVRCLDVKTRQQFEVAHKDVEFPKFEELSKFLKSHCTAMNYVETSNQRTSSTLSSPNSKPIRNVNFRSKALLSGNQTSKGFNNSTQPQCVICKDGKHKILQCAKFYAASPIQRSQLLSKWKGCRNCLSYEHNTFKCSSNWLCRLCSKRHHTMLHLDQTSSNKNTNDINKPSTSQIKVPTNMESKALSTSSSDLHVVLGTVSTTIEDACGHLHTIRLVIDSGSQHSFITNQLAERLGIKRQYFPKKISGIGQTPLEGAKGQIDCIIRPRNSKTSLSTKAVVVKNITSFLPNIKIPSKVQQVFREYELADPEFWRPAPVDFLLGADLFPDIWLGEAINFGDNFPKLFPSVFGYIAMGKMSTFSHSDANISLSTVTELDDLNYQLQRFWEIEEPLPASKIIDPEHEACEEHFLQNHHRLDSGRYVVRLPFKRDPPDFKESISVGLRRFYNLEAKLRKNPSLYDQYKDFMSEYIDLNHMELVDGSTSYLLPHHCVSKEDRGIIKIRVVFDPSFKTPLGSLNDYLHVGEKLQKDIRDILLNFRIFPIVFVADITKMYRNILLDARDRSYQHIFWRFDQSCSLQRYELRTLTYGFSCAPFLAQRVIRQLCLDEGPNFPLAAEVLERDMYIDDLVTGEYSVPAALELQRQVIELLKKGGFTLSKWASNSPEIVDPLSETNRSTDPIQLMPKEDSYIKLLGLQWDPVSDNFTYKVKTINNTVFTKRAILSTVSRIYDPLGFLSPLLILMKHFIQTLWKEGYDWDEEVSVDLQNSWKIIIEQLSSLSMIKIPRFVGAYNATSAQIIGFCDASTKGFCGVLYLRIEQNSGIQVHLLKAKTKLSPLKTISIPRLELCGALLLSKLFKSIDKFTQLIPTKWIPACFFSDSSTVLTWLKTPPFKLKTFEANRVSEISDLTSSVTWRHVRSEDNPGDCGTRGLTPEQIQQHELWWKGPKFLKKPSSEWPNENVLILEDLSGLKLNSSALVTKQEENNYSEDLTLQFMQKFSCLLTMLRSLSWIRRTMKYWRSPAPQPCSLPLQLTEFEDSKIICIKYIQLQYFFKGDVNNLHKVKKDYHKLSPFIDEAGILRVGGRLRNANLPDYAKHPILLPAKAHFTRLLVDHYHIILLHGGPNLMQAFIQQKYWIISSRRLIRQRIYRCLKCYKLTAKPKVPLMGDLPKQNVVEGPVFSHTGVDFAGPFTIRESLRRKSSLGKAYLCIFVCLKTKAIHLEVVSKLTSEAFLAAFDRFISRRGLPSDMYSDCGTNFVGAANKMKDFVIFFNSPSNKSAVTRHSVKCGVNWHFNPPHSPHFGGRWEAAVKLAKTFLVKIVSNTALTFEELTTTFAKIESVLNSRPLCPLSSDPNENDYLTPGHFLIGRPLLSNPEPSLLDQKEYSLTRWQLVKRLTQDFWKRWRCEYLATLQVRNKWTRDVKNIKVGDLVLLKEDAPVMQWPLARVIETHPGADGVVRVVTIKTGSSTYKRPVTKLAPLNPLND